MLRAGGRAGGRGAGGRDTQNSYLVRILHDEVLALRQLHADVDDAAQDAPRVLHVQVDLLRELRRLELLHAEDDVLRRVDRVHARHVPARQNAEKKLRQNFEKKKDKGKIKNNFFFGEIPDLKKLTKNVRVLHGQVTRRIYLPVRVRASKKTKNCRSMARADCS